MLFMYPYIMVCECHKGIAYIFISFVSLSLWNFNGSVTDRRTFPPHNSFQFRTCSSSNAKLSDQ